MPATSTYYAVRFLTRVYGAGRWAAIAQALLLMISFYAARGFLYRPLLFFIVHALR